MRRPNVLVILADDMGYGDFGAFGDGTPETPHLDRLAAEGLSLTHHYSAAPVCAPARACLLTGRYPHRTGAIDTFEGRGLDRLALGERTLADSFRAAGYATGLVGKWHLGALDDRYHPTRRGFDTFLGFRGGWSDYWQWSLDHNGRRIPADGRYLTDVFADAAVAFVRQHRNEPFFLHLAFNAPHFPFQASAEDLGRFLDRGLTRGVATLYAMVRCMDAGVGRVLEELDRQGLREDTIVLFTSDNGPQLGGQGEMCLDRFNAWLRGSKGNVFEGGIRVPALLRWPGGLPGRGTQSHQLMHFSDWFPTLLAAAGLDPEPGRTLDGHAAPDVLRGEIRGSTPPRFWQWNRYTPEVTCNAAVRVGDWKLVRPVIGQAMRVEPEDSAMDRRLKYEPGEFTDIRRAPLPARDLPPPPAPLLFHLASDPYEKEDLAAREPARVASLLRQLETWFETVEAERRAIRE